MTNAVAINDKVRQDESPTYLTRIKKKKKKKKKLYHVRNKESNRLAWQTGGVFLFALHKSAEKSVSVLWYAKSKRVCIHSNYVGSLQSWYHNGQNIFW